MAHSALTPRLLVKSCLQGVSLTVAFPAALLCGFGRATALFQLFAHCYAALPGFVGHFLRAAFYKLTLDHSSLDVVIAYGSFFSRRQASLAPNVSIGSYCIIGAARIGARTQISSHVEIPGGRLQHSRDANGRLSNTIEETGSSLFIGEDCWIGASAIVMANIGARSTIGAGSVVVKDIPPGVVAVGSPARVIKPSFGSNPQASQ